MGSYLTIVNDTPDNWECKVGPDKKALKIGTWIAGAIGAIALTVATLGMAAPWIAGASSIVGASTSAISVLGVPTAALAMVANTVAGATAITAGVIGGSSMFSIAVANGLSKDLHKKGYDSIMANQSKRYGKMTLSLWQQCECKKVTVTPTTIDVYTLLMRPIFSGPTKNSNRDHSIQWWIQKDGTQKDTIKGSDVVAPRDDALPSDDASPIDVATPIDDATPSFEVASRILEEETIQYSTTD